MRNLSSLLLAGAAFASCLLTQTPAIGIDVESLLEHEWIMDFPKEDDSLGYRRLMGYRSFPFPLQPPHKVLWQFKLGLALAYARYECRAKRVPVEYKDEANAAAAKRIDQWLKDMDMSKKPSYLNQFTDQTFRNYLHHWLGTNSGKEAILKMSSYLEENPKCLFSTKINNEIDRDGNVSLRYWEEFRQFEESYLWEKYEKHGE